MNRTIRLNALTLGLAFLIIGGCGQSADESAAVTPAEPAISIYDAAVASTARPAADRARDADRKPAEVLEFMGIKPGMTVLDLFTGSGYYAEIIAGVVGVDGKVVAQTNAAYLGYVGDAFEERFGSGRLQNVEVMMAENNELSLPPDTFDAIMLVLSFHDLYHVDAENGWPQIDGVAFLAELRKGLKPGGIVAIIDHSAAAGAPPETGTTLHRIDPQLVITNMEASGFELDGQSDLLRNPDDDLTKSVFAPEIRGKTDRFVLRFRRPE